ncbi:MAG: PAS domain-containing protein [Chitinophagaceae bacterium]
MKTQSENVDCQPFCTPLLSWDIFLEGYHRRIALARDLQQLNEISHQNSWSVAWDLEDMLLKKEKVILVTDTSQTIAFASSNLLNMNGYLPSEVIGHSPRIFQGKQTDPELKSVARNAISSSRPFKLSVVNYRKNGLLYHCRVEGYPVFNRKRDLVNFIAFESIEESGY